MNIQERLAVFFQRLQAAPPASSADEAFSLICRTMDEVEDKFCTVPKKFPPPKDFEGRMYLPQPDNIIPRDDGSFWVKTRRHRISIKSGGSFIIFRKIDSKHLVEEMRKDGATR